MYIQYGCGWSSGAGWTNFDASPTLRFERIPFLGRLYSKNAQRFPADIVFGDIVTGLPIGENSCYGIYCSHVLEHLSLDDMRIALKNTHRYLVNEGIFRLVMPDLRFLVTDYLEDKRREAALTFIERTGMGKQRRPRGLLGFVKEYFGNSQHLWLWDEASLYQELLNVGFVDIRRCEFGDSLDKRFSDVEDESRFINCLAMECKKRIKN